MKIKKCSKCGEEKPETREFYYCYKYKYKGCVENRLRNVCKNCVNETTREYRKKNNDKILSDQRKRRQKIKDTPEYKEAKKISDAKYYKKNKDKILSKNRRYYQENKAQIIKKHGEYQKKWRKTDRGSEWMKKYSRDKIKNDENHRLKKNLRSRLWHALAGKSKSASTVELLGCSIEQLKIHLQGLFQLGMTWDNYGNPDEDHKKSWHVDHIRPCASFNLCNPIEQRECFHYTNLQPLWGKDNLSKGDKWDG